MDNNDKSLIMRTILLRIVILCLLACMNSCDAGNNAGEHIHPSIFLVRETTRDFTSLEDFDKLEGLDIKYGETGVPIVMNECAAYLECKVVEKFDVGTHLIFIGELIQAEIVALIFTSTSG